MSIWGGRIDSKSDLICVVCAQHGHLFRMKIVTINVTTKYGFYLEGVSLPTMMSGQALVGGSDVSNR